MREYLDLQLFGEGGDGGSAGEGTGESIGKTDELARIPERARATYQRALAKHKPAEVATQQTTVDETDKPQHVPFKDLIKSDEYKDEHKAYMDNAIQDRFKKYKGMEESNKKMTDALGIVANKYGLDITSETFLDDLTSKIAEDKSYYEEYAMEHDISTDEAKEILDLKKEVALQKQKDAMREAAEAELEKQQKLQNEMALLQASAERTKAMYPSFDLETEMQNEKFRMLCAATHHDTLAAYRAIHMDELMNAQSYVMAQQANQQAANAIAANKSRPIENGLSSQAATLTQTSWKGASLAEIRRYADEQRRMKK